ncbi:MAG: sulfatase-like hydrolase/transferase, partial [Chthoniobacteraceae bacterium]
MKHIVLALLLSSFAICHSAFAAQPNVLLIYSDDHGWADLGAQGVDTDIRTPNLDQLARDGVRFMRGYVSAPQCVPSRAGVLTGRYQQKFGVEDNNKGPLPLAELTIAERLKPAGYVSGQVGKWHLTPPPRGKGKGGKGSEEEGDGGNNFQPWTQGFDEYWCGAMRQYHASHDLKGSPFADAPHMVGAEKNTLIWFIVDNGAPLKEGAWDGSLNLPLVGEKGMLTDGGIRTPFVAAWPGRIPAGQTYEHPVSSLDVAATAVAVAGLPHEAALDGVNLMPFLTDENRAAPHEAFYWRWRSQSAVLE